MEKIDRFDNHRGIFDLCRNLCTCGPKRRLAARPKPHHYVQGPNRASRSVSRIRSETRGESGRPSDWRWPRSTQHSPDSGYRQQRFLGAQRPSQPEESCGEATVNRPTGKIGAETLSARYALRDPRRHGSYSGQVDIGLPRSRLARLGASAAGCVGRKSRR